MINKNSRVVAADDITFADLGGEAVVLNLNAGVYFGLNEAGARILSLLREPARVEELITALMPDYDVTREQLERDIIGFIEGLTRREIIRVEKDTDAGVGSRAAAQYAPKVD